MQKSKFVSLLGHFFMLVFRCIILGSPETVCRFEKRVLLTFTRGHCRVGFWCPLGIYTLVGWTMDISNSRTFDSPLQPSISRDWTYFWYSKICFTKVRLGYCFTPYQRLRLYNGAPFSRLLRHAGDTEDLFSA